jgi:Methyltransferase FkbM domain
MVEDCTAMWRLTPKRQALRWYLAVLKNLPETARTRKLYAADFQMNGVCSFFCFGQRFDVDVDALNTATTDMLKGNAFAFLRELFVRQIYFREFANAKFTNCLDLGCNVGVVANLFRQLGGDEGRVIAVDPLQYPDSAFWRAAQSTPGLNYVRGFLCSSAMVDDPVQLRQACEPYQFDPTTAVTVQQLIDRFGISHFDFVKIDIEGAEFSIFSEPTPWLAQIDNIAMEVHSDCGDISDLVRHLQEYGFEVRWKDDFGFDIDVRNAGYVYASRIGSLR